MTPQNTQPSPADIVAITASDARPESRIELLLDDGGRTPALRRTLTAIVGLTAIFIAWAVLARVDELARARGEIQPGGHIQILQTEEGGSIVNLMVKEGDQVKAGQAIAEFAATDLDKSKAQADIKLNAVMIDRERILAILENRNPDFTKFAKDYPLLVDQARVSYKEQITNRDAALMAKRGEAAQQESLLAGAEREKDLIAREVQEARNWLSRLEAGTRKGVVSELSLSQSRQQVTSREERQSEVVARVESIKKNIGSVNAEINRLRADFNQQLSLELSKLTEQYRELLAERQALDERQGRALIKSPVDGVVMGLPQTSVGAVIPAGGTVAEIVPTDQEVIMETMVMPRDIGFVKVGQRASVKIDSFDAARFGSVEGTVKRVSPTSTKMKENGMPFYKVEIALATPYVSNEKHRLIPGMTGEADIATGRKSVMQFLLKPIFLASDTAFHER